MTMCFQIFLIFQGLQFALGEKSSIRKEHNISGDRLLQLTSEDLRDIGSGSELLQGWDVFERGEGWG